MTTSTMKRAALPAVLAAVFAVTTPAIAHHGWGWAEGELTTMTGIIQTVAISPPHPVVEVQAEDGTVWTVELGNPGRTQRAGFVEGVAEAGDSITIMGNRSLNTGETRMKAVSVTLDDKDYVFYPERMPEN